MNINGTQLYINGKKSRFGEISRLEKTIRENFLGKKLRFGKISLALKLRFDNTFLDRNFDLERFSLLEIPIFRTNSTKKYNKLWRWVPSKSSWTDSFCANVPPRNVCRVFIIFHSKFEKVNIIDSDFENFE